ncbi:hypothetical protein GobsT_23300 [Gemmata obscuriglobus]|uniref:HEPN domain-containing protein n=1 Tax=Gemmata obscuriglobus TaxID=114 RepID=UPI0011CD17F0
MMIESEKQFIEFTTTAHSDLNGSGFAQVINLGALPLNGSFKIDDGLQLRRALPNELATLQKAFALTYPPRAFSFPLRNPYETFVREERQSSSHSSIIVENLPQDQWRYHVVYFDGPSRQLFDFIESTILTKNRLQMGMVVHTFPGSPAPCYGGYSNLARHSEAFWNSDEVFCNVTEADIDDMKSVYTKLKSGRDTIPRLANALTQFAQLDSIPSHSALRFLGYVSIIESLIAHKSDQNNPADSLTNQVSKKMALVGHRSKLPIPYDLLGVKGTNKHTMEVQSWRILYSYRSAIAHGSKPNFSNEFSCLRSPAIALEFITRSTTALMRHYLDDPLLMNDLREC